MKNRQRQLSRTPAPYLEPSKSPLLLLTSPPTVPGPQSHGDHLTSHDAAPQPLEGDESQIEASHDFTEGSHDITEGSHDVRQSTRSDYIQVGTLSTGGLESHDGHLTVSGDPVASGSDVSVDDEVKSKSDTPQPTEHAQERDQVSNQNCVGHY